MKSIAPERQNVQLPASVGQAAGLRRDKAVVGDRVERR